MLRKKGRNGSTATACPKRQGCAPGREVVGSIPPAAVTVRLHSWLCRGKTTELPTWGERSEKDGSGVRGNEHFASLWKSKGGCVMCHW
jgi:hypothetical protein